MTNVSVIVISKNERGLEPTLRVLSPQCTELGAELLVVDASRGALDDVAARFPDVKWIDFVTPGGKKVTIPEQRNAGVRAASGEILAFTDCGCQPESGWLDALTGPIRAGAEQVVAGANKSLRPSVYDGPDGRVGGACYVEECGSGNLAFTRAAFDTVGGFDEFFEYGSDVDMSWRWRDAGIRILRVPSATILIDWGSDSRQVKRSLLWGRGRARLYVKHRGRLRGLLRRDPIAIAYPLFLLGLPLMVISSLISPWALLYPLLLAVPLWRSRRTRPFHTVLGHLAFGAGFLRELARGVRR